MTASHFTYAENPSKTELMQGDILKRTEAMDELLKLVHPHFYNSPKNEYFMVLTQSCDLVERHGGVCKAPYITIAPVRRLQHILDKQVAELTDSNLNTVLPVGVSKSKGKLTEFLQRLYNNNESGLFFLESSSTELHHDYCAILGLSIAIKAGEHYKKCLDAKLLELNGAFQAKLGWLVGQMYSRVGTEDWEQAKLQEKIKNTLRDSAIWVPDDKALTFLRERLTLEEPGGEAIPESRINQIIKEIPLHKKTVLDRALAVASEIFTDEAEVKRLKRRLENDAALTQLLKK